MQSGQVPATVVVLLLDVDVVVEVLLVVVAEVGVWGVGCVGRRGRGPLGIGRRFCALLYFFESAFECVQAGERMGGAAVWETG